MALLELPRVAAGFFRLSSRRAETYVAGLSMGGYGALKWALRQPDRFAAAASLSGALDLASRQRGPVRGRRIEGNDDDVFARSEFGPGDHDWATGTPRSRTS